MEPTGAVNFKSLPEAKISLFRALFRGRADVYPRRFESRKTGRTGYAPACGNEWVRGICEKPRIKCAECAHRRFLPVTDEVIRWHLSGRDDGRGRCASQDALRPRLEGVRRERLFLQGVMDSSFQRIDSWWLPARIPLPGA